MQTFRFNIINDPECGCGSLMVVEAERDIPFAIRRIFFVYGVQPNQIRGEHAHRGASQILCCIRGTCSITLDDGTHQEEYLLDSPDKAVLQPPLVWGRIAHLRPGSMLMVLSDSYYDPDDYIHDYDTFVQLVRERRSDG